MVLRNYLDKVKQGFLIGLATLSFYALPLTAQAQETKKSELEKIVVSEDSLKNSNEDNTKQDYRSSFSHVSLLINFNTSKLEAAVIFPQHPKDQDDELPPLKEGERLALEWSISVINKKNDYGFLFGGAFSRIMNLNKKTLIIPYFLYEFSLGDKEGVLIKTVDSSGEISYEKVPESHLKDFGNVSLGLKLRKKILKESDPFNKLGVDIRYIYYPQRKKGGDLIVGVFKYFK